MSYYIIPNARWRGNENDDNFVAATLLSSMPRVLPGILLIDTPSCIIGDERNGIGTNLESQG